MYVLASYNEHLSPFYLVFVPFLLVPFFFSFFFGIHSDDVRRRRRRRRRRKVFSPGPHTCIVCRIGNIKEHDATYAMLCYAIDLRR